MTVEKVAVGAVDAITATTMPFIGRG